MISQLLKVRNLGEAQLKGSVQRCSRGSSHHVGQAAVISELDWVKGPMSKLTHGVAAGPSSSLAFFRASDTLESWPTSQRTLKMEAAFYNQLSEGTARHSAVYSLSHGQSLVQSRRELYKIRMSGGRDHWGPPWRLPTIGAFTPVLLFNFPSSMPI